MERTRNYRKEGGTKEKKEANAGSALLTKSRTAGDGQRKQRGKTGRQSWLSPAVGEGGVEPTDLPKNLTARYFPESRNG